MYAVHNSNANELKFIDVNLYDVVCPCFVFNGLARISFYQILKTQRDVGNTVQGLHFL